MHDPDVVAFDIRRPWPKRSRDYDAKPGWPRWKFGWSSWTVAGRGLYWPSMITIWHREPGGADSGEVCKHYIRHQDEDGKWRTKILHGWKFHVHHWRLQLHPLQSLRRWALTRCAWCGGRQRKGDAICTSNSGWDAPRGPWWRGEADLYHRDCSAIQRAHRTCTCVDPLLEHAGWGHCSLCGKDRSYGRTELQAEQTRILAAVPAGQRDPAAYRRICDMYAASERAAT